MFSLWGKVNKKSNSLRLSSCGLWKNRQESPETVPMATGPTQRKFSLVAPKSSVDACV